MTEDYLYRDPDCPWEAYLRSYAKIGIGGGRNRCAQMSLKKSYRSLPKHLKRALATSAPEISRILAKKALKQTQDFVPKLP
jgi:hypothetical protein